MMFFYMLLAACWVVVAGVGIYAAIGLFVELRALYTNHKYSLQYGMHYDCNCRPNWYIGIHAGILLFCILFLLITL